MSMWLQRGTINMNQASNIGWCNWVCIIQEGPQLKAPYKSSTDCVNFPYTIRFHKGDTQYPGTKHNKIDSDNVFSSTNA